MRSMDNADRFEINGVKNMYIIFLKLFPLMMMLQNYLERRHWLSETIQYK